MRLRISVSLFLLVVSLATFAQSGQWGSRGISRRFVIDGNRLFAADGRGVSVYDTEGVKRLAFAETRTESVDVAALSDGSVVVATKGALERFAVAADGSLTARDPLEIPNVYRIAAGNGLIAGATPSGVMLWSNEGDPRGTFAVHNSVNALALRGNALFVAVEGEGVSIFDVTDPNNIAIVAANAKDFAFQGNTLFMAGGVDGLVIADVSQPFAPRVLSRTDAGVINAGRIAVAGNVAAAGQLPGTIIVYDVTALDAPRAVRTITDEVQTMAMKGSRLFFAGTIVDAFGLPTETGKPLEAIDHPESSSATMAVTDLPGPVSGVATDGTLAYVVDRPFFRVIDVSKSSSPREIASLEIAGIGDHVKVKDKQVILYGRGDVQLIDVSNPYAPQLVNTFVQNGRPPSNAAFVRNGILEGNPWTGFHVIDFSYRPAPAITASIKSHYYEIVSNGDDIAYLGAEAQAIAVVDVGTQGLATERALVRVGITQADIAAATGNHPQLLLVRGPAGMHVFSLADPFHPVEIGSTPLENRGAFAAAGDVAYIATGDGTVAVMDVSNPSSPALAPTTMKSVSPMQVAFANGKLVIADRYSLRVYGANTTPPPPPPNAVPARRRSASH